MDQDFYIKAQALQEQFQKRELHYQNTERKLRNSTMYKKEFNTPLQEYLQKIKQREQETDEIYSSIMKQMDVLDEKADSMILNFDKMEFLKNSLTDLSIPSWQSNVISQQVPSTSQNFNAKIRNSRLESVQSNFTPTFEINSTTTSTQTEDLYCEECGFLIHNQSNLLVKKTLESSSSILSKIQDEEREFTPVNYPISLSELQEVQNSSDFGTSSVNNISALAVNTDKRINPQFITTSVNSSFIPKSVNDDSSFLNQNFIAEEISEKSDNHNSNQKIDERLNSAKDEGESNKAKANKPNEENPRKNVEESNTSLGSNKKREIGNRTVNERHDIPKNQKELSNVKEINPQADITENAEKVIESQVSENKIYESKSETEINIDTYVSKSDVESMNNEFDFLETDTQNKSSKIDIQQSSEDNKPLSVNSNYKKIPSLEIEHSKKKEKIKNIFKPDSNLHLENEQSEISGSVSSSHSPNLSLASDSDSSYRKESPLKESAAYQALLGNTIIPKVREKVASESESEDEVESALTTVVQKANVKPKSSIQSKKDKSAPQVVESKPVVKKSQLSSGNIPQSKLSKSTRKVLGLDTSSGSEVECLKPPEKKVDDDSDDEFFFG